MILALILCGCSVDIGEYEKTLIPYEEFEMVYGEAPDRVNDLKDFHENITYYTERYGGFVGTVIPVEYRFYQQYCYSDGRWPWSQDGYVEIVCEITEISEKYNTTSFHIGDQIVLREKIILQFKSDDPDVRRALMEKIGIQLDPETGTLAPLTEEEQQKYQQETRLAREYRVPDQLINTTDFKLFIYNQVGLLLPKTPYDVVIVKTTHDYFAYYASAQNEKVTGSKEHMSDDIKVCTNQFRQYLSENRASLGLAPIEAEK